VSLREDLVAPASHRCVLLTDGDTRAALAITRSLGRAGYEVHVVSAKGRSLCGASRWCRADHAVGDALSQPALWVQQVESLARALDASVLPITEVAAGSLFACGSDARVDLIAPSRSDYEAAIDKYGIVERALRLGIDVPESVLIERLGALETVPEPLCFPVVAKPRRSRILAEDGWHEPPVQVLREPADLRNSIACWLPAHGDTLLQEYVPGHGEGFFALCDRGEIQARFAHRRLREKPPLGGVSVLRESIDVPADVGHQSELLLGDLGFSGLAMVEFRRTPDGRPVLMEINPRPWGSLQLAIDAGVDFPRLMVEGRQGILPDASVDRARSGVRTRWLLGDVDHWLACARSRAVRGELETSLAGITRDFLGSFFDGSQLEVLRAGDLRPFLRELAQWLAALVRP
jgi:predicted ATP-grasp superfamily ATP-dependent carboligase